MSGIAEEVLLTAVPEARKAAWERDHADAIRQYNDTVHSQGLWSDGLRSV